MKSFEEFIQEGKVRQGRTDIAKAKSLIKMSENTLAASFELSEEQASSILTLVYSSLRQVLEARALTEGYHMYSHEAYTAYLFSKKEKALGTKFDRLRTLRNKVEYSGEEINKNTAISARKEVKLLRKEILNKITTKEN